MASLKELMDGAKFEDNSIERIEYEYNEAKFKHVWLGLATKCIENLKIGAQQAIIWGELIKYIHGNKDCAYWLNKAICLVGATGSGKTQTIHIMNKYIETGNIYYKRAGKVMPFMFRVVTSIEIASEYALKGYDGVENYKRIGNLCIDDLGNEPETLNHYGNKLDVISDLIEHRYNKGLLTHFTTNLNEEEIKGRYNSRVHSRIMHSCNVIIMNDKDFRLTK